ncbi:MAG TPA: hypothetical protein VIJ51_18490 [Solirubrobacteraceae bacterium]
MLHEPAGPDRPQRELRDVLAGLRRRAWVFALSVVVVAGLAFLIARSRANVYTASAVVVFDVAGQLQQSLFGPASAPQETADQQTATDHDLVTLPIIARRTAARLGRGLTAQDVSDRISVPAGDQSDTVTVQAVGPSAADAAQLANAFVAETIAYQRSNTQNQILAARDGVEREIAQAAGQRPSLAARRAQLSTLDADVLKMRLMAAVDDGGIQLAQPALRPNSPTSPRPAHDALIGGFAGLLLGLVLALMLDQADDRVRDPDGTSAALGLPLLAVVPGQKRRRGGHPAAASTPAALQEPMRRLHARLRSGRRPSGARSVLVTSPTRGSGTTTVAWHLAAAAAEAGERVVLVEADLREPDLAALLGEDGGAGLVDLLRTPRADRSKFVRRVRLPLRNAASSEGAPEQGVREAGAERGGSGLDVLFGGFADEDAYALLASDAMSRILRELMQSYDRVIVDSPPASLFSDAMPLMNLVDGVIIVVRVRQDTIAGAQHLATELRETGIEPLGIVVNGATTASSGAAFQAGPGLRRGVERDVDRQVSAAAAR